MSETYFFNKNSILPLAFVFVMAVVSVGVWIGEQISDGSAQDEAVEIWKQMKWHPAQSGGYTYIHFFDMGDRGAKAIQGTTSRGRKSPRLGTSNKRGCYQWRFWPKTLRMSQNVNGGYTVFSSHQRGYVFVTVLSPQDTACRKLNSKRDAQKRKAAKQKRQREMVKGLGPSEKRIKVTFGNTTKREIPLAPGKCLLIEKRTGFINYGYIEMGGREWHVSVFTPGHKEPQRARAATFTSILDRGHVMIVIAPLTSSACKKAFIYRPN